MRSRPNSLQVMNPTVEAGWIAAGVGVVGIIGTSVVAVVGARSTKDATTATLDAEHEGRVWDKRADVYVQAIYLLNRTKVIRGQFTEPETWTSQVVEQLRNLR
jgi:hypothetical protein